LKRQFQSYVLTPNNTLEEHQNFVGKEAHFLTQLNNHKIPIYPTFFITSKAFDDFLNSNALIEVITEELSKVKIFNRESFKNASTKINNLIEEANFPNIIKSPIKLAYNNMGLGFNFRVLLKPSNIINKEFVVSENNLSFAKGETGLFKEIKEQWKSLFSEKSIAQRTNHYYKGAITMGIIIQKEAYPEISGKVIIKNNDSATIYSGFGVLKTNFFDKYTVIFKKNLGKIVDKKICPQSEMQIKNINGNITKISLSPNNKAKQKLSDCLISEVSIIARKCQKILNSDFIISFNVERGKLYITDLEDYDKKAIPDLEIPESKQQKTKITIFKDLDKSLPKSLITEINVQNDRDFFSNPFFIDLSLMDSRTFAFAKKFSGGLIDSNTILKRDNKNHVKFLLNTNFKNLISFLKLEILTAVKILNKKTLTYVFADFSNFINLENERDIPRLKSKLFIAELFAILEVINNINLQKIILCFPETLSNLEYQSFRKKTIENFNKIKQNFEIFIKINDLNAPKLNILMLKNENSLDGVLIDEESFSKLPFKNDLRKAVIFSQKSFSNIKSLVNPHSDILILKNEITNKIIEELKKELDL